MVHLLGGTCPANAVYNAVVMEKVAEMDIKTLMLNPKASMQQYVLDKHYMIKHGSNAYYGQKRLAGGHRGRNVH